jgi:hypothetical protein
MTPEERPATLADDEIETRRAGASYAEVPTSDDTGDDTGDDSGDDSGDPTDVSDSGDDSGDDSGYAA